MALITCPKCGKQFSDRAEKCPQCEITKEEALVLIKKQQEEIRIAAEREAAERERLRKEREAKEAEKARLRAERWKKNRKYVFLLIFITVVCVISYFPINTYLHTPTWKLEDGVLTISPHFSIEATMEDYDTEDVKEAPWYSERDEIKSVVINEGIKNIGANAFEGCSHLTSVTIPISVTSIGMSAFKGCISLSSITISENITDISSSAFTDCTALVSVTLNSNSIVNDWYSSDHNIGNIFGAQVKEYIIGKSVTCISDYAFCYLYNLTSVTIPNSVTSIGKWAFHGCSGLTSITIPESTKSIGYTAFSGCSGLTKVNISDIAAWCDINFEDYSNPLWEAKHLYLNGEEIKDLVIPNSVTSIGYEAFHNCIGLTSVTIPSSVTRIEDWAFIGCSGMTSITIPHSVTRIGKEAFKYCSALTSVTIDADDIMSNSYTSSSNLKNIFGSQVTEYIIGNSVTSIGNYAFYQCTGLTSITIPNSVTSIGDGAFEGCTGLTSVTIPNSVTSIGRWAFSYNSGLLSITIPYSVYSVASDAFYECSNLHIKLPERLSGKVMIHDCKKVTYY